MFALLVAINKPFLNYLFPPTCSDGGTLLLVHAENPSKKVTKPHRIDCLGFRAIVALTAISICGCITNGDKKASSKGDRVTVFDNFGPNWTGYRRGGWSVAGVHGGNNWGVEQAMAFIPSEGGTLSDVWVPLSYAPEDKAKAVVFKLALDSNSLPGKVLESWSLDNGFTTWEEPGSPHHMTGSGRTTLEAGKRYWLWATAEDSTFLAWNDHVDPRSLCFHTERRERQNWLPGANETCSVFRVDVLKP